MYYLASHPPMKTWSKLWFWLPKNTPSPPPPKMKTCSELGTLSFDYPRIPPPPENGNLVRTWHFDFDYLRIPPPPHPPLPWKWTIGQNLALWVLTTQEYPPSIKWKLGQNLALWVLTTQESPPPENGNLVRTWHFDFDYLRIPPNFHFPENEHLVRTWHFEFWLPKNTPLP